MRNLKLAVIVVFVSLISSGFASGNIYKFDMGTPASPLWEGFTKITEKIIYTSQTGYGWRTEAGQSIECRIKGVPDALTCAVVAPDKGFYVYSEGQMEFILDLTNGDYGVYVLTGDYTGSQYEYGTTLSWSISAEGEISADVQIDAQSWSKVVHRLMYADYRKGEDIWEKYVTPRFVPTRFNVNVADGQLNLIFKNTTVNAVMIYPVAEAQQFEDFVTDLNRKRKASFPLKDITPRPTGEMKGITKTDRGRGYVVFYPNYMEDIGPFDLPKTGQRLKERLEAFAAQGDYSPVTFVVRPLEDLKSCMVDVSDLTGPKGAVLKPSDWDVRFVRYLEIPDSSTYEIKPIMAMKIYPIDLDKGVNKEFWLTLKVPESVVPGIYSGMVTFKPKDADAAQIPIRVRVLPFKLKPLEDSGRYEGNWWSGPKFSLTMPQVIADLKAHGMNVIHGVPAPQAKLVKGELVFDSTDTENYLNQLRKAGYPMKLIVWQGATNQAYSLTNEPFIDPEWLKERGGHSDHQVKKSFGAEFQVVFKKLARGIDNLFKKKGWPSIYFYEGGELGGEGYWGVWTETKLMKMLKEAGVKNTTSVTSREALDAELPYLYAAQIVRSQATPEVRKIIRKAKAKLWIYYLGTTRFQRGFWFWKSGAEGCAPEGYAHAFGDPYNEFDGRYEQQGYVFPSPDGPVPMLKWERIREGITDAKYIAHLNLMIRDAQKSKNTQIRKAAKEAQIALNEVMAQINPDINYYSSSEPDGYTMDLWRWQIADQIIKLQSAIDSSITKPRK